MFLDRDGVINASVVRDGRPFPPQTVADFCLLPGVNDACARLRAAGFVLVVATNQPDVGRGTQSRATVEEMHRRMCEQIFLDRVEVCYDAEDTEFSVFRKPKPGMLLRAAEALELDLSASFMVGDRWRDIDCGHAAGCRTILIDYGYAEALRMPPDFRVPDLSGAADLILSL